MDLQLLAKDSGSGTVGCPSVHRDRDRDDGTVVVQGDGIPLVGPSGTVWAVRIHAGTVARALGWTSFVADADIVVAGGEPVDVDDLPNPLPGERAVRARVEHLQAALDTLTAERSPV